MFMTFMPRHTPTWRGRHRRSGWDPGGYVGWGGKLPLKLTADKSGPTGHTFTQAHNCNQCTSCCVTPGCSWHKCASVALPMIAIKLFGYQVELGWHHMFSCGRPRSSQETSNTLSTTMCSLRPRSTDGPRTATPYKHTWAAATPT
jgi:hypothetical protein